MLYNISIKKDRLTFSKYLLIIVFVYTSVNISAQEESCTQSLVDAQEVFASGRIEEVPGILEGCLERGFNRQEKVAAYRLLTLCHLYYNRNVDAAATMQKLLRIQPEYRIQDIDPSEFINLHSTFRTSPLFIIGVKGGFGTLHFYETTNYNDINSINHNGRYEVGQLPPLMLGLSIEVPILKELSFVSEIYYNQYEYLFKRSVLEYASVEFTETVKGIEIPVMAQWNILKNKQVIPYINAGANFYFTLESTGKIIREDTLSGAVDRDVPGLDNIDLISSRNKFNVAFTTGAGVRIKDVIGNGYLTFDFRYSRYFKNHVEENLRAETPSLSYTYLYTDNSFKMESFQFIVGYKLPIYFCRQRKASRPEY